MRKIYLGSKIDAFAAIVAPLFVCFPLFFAVYAFLSGIDNARLVLSLSCIICSVVWCSYLKFISIKVYSWGHFFDDRIQVYTAFLKPYSIEYKKCATCGIGYYTHGILNSKIGTKVYYFFFSYDIFDENYRSRINLWHSTRTQIKVKYSRKMYDFLIMVLPKTQQRAIVSDFNKYLGNKET